MKEERKQIKSKNRVTKHGEVFTGEREVKAMCDLVSQECDRIDSRFLEPACGNRSSILFATSGGVNTSSLDKFARHNKTSGVCKVLFL